MIIPHLILLHNNTNIPPDYYTSGIADRDSIIIMIALLVITGIFLISQNIKRKRRKRPLRENIGDIRFSKPKRHSKLTFLIESIKSFFRSKKYARMSRTI